MKIGQYLAKIWTSGSGLLFLGHPVELDLCFEGSSRASYLSKVGPVSKSARVAMSDHIHMSMHELQ